MISGFIYCKYFSLLPELHMGDDSNDWW